jgi:excisionase family DNA binding protein
MRADGTWAQDEAGRGAEITQITLTLPTAVIEEIAARAALIALGALRARAETDSPFLSIPETAALLRVPRQTVDDWLSRGKLRRYKAGRRTLLLRTEVEAFAAPERTHR